MGEKLCWERERPARPPGTEQLAEASRGGGTISGPRQAPPEGCVATVARIHGRVQGVGYRYWTRTQAESLNLRGYVRNLTDGTVEALLIGEPADVARMLTFCEDGPPTAEVAKVETSKPGPAHRLDMDRFRRAPTRKPGEPV